MSPAMTVIDKPSQVTEENITALIERIRQPDFLVGLAFNLAAQIVFKLVARGDTEHLTLIDGTPYLKTEITQYVHKSLQLDIIDRPIYWREIAKNLLIDKKQSGKSDEQFMTNLVTPLLNRLISDANLDTLPSYILVQILGLRLEQELEALHKLSKTQKHILVELFKRGMSLPAETAVIPWLPDKLFPNLTSSDRVSISKSLKRLSERNLIQRLNIDQTPISIGEEQSSRRTAFVRLTELGLSVARRLHFSTIPFNQATY